MFYNEHHPPHYHAKYGADRVMVNIQTGQVMEGSLPKRAMALVREWHGLHGEDLLADWRLAELRKPLKKIEPLE